MCNICEHNRKTIIGLGVGLALFFIVSATLLSFYKYDTGIVLELSLAHINDVHARFVETSRVSSTCKGDRCISGFPRLYTVIEKLKDRPNFIFLDAGDTFQGTPYYTLFRWNVTSYLLNLFPFDAHALGNHEFDDNMAGLLPFLKTLRAPVVACNIDDELEPEMKNLYQKSIIIERNGKKIGIIGVTVSNTRELSHPGRLKFKDEVNSINTEAEKLSAQKVFTIIVLSHCGYKIEQHIAMNAVSQISVIVGGHSHSLLYNGTAPSDETTEGLYPTVIEQVDGDKVLVLQAGAWTRYVGNISLFYDKKGRLQHWEGNPIFLDTDIQEDKDVIKLLQPYQNIVDKKGLELIGETVTTLDQTNCLYEECNIGNLFADAMLDKYQNANLSILSPTGIRSNIETGEIRFNDLRYVHPYGHTIDIGVLKGAILKQAFEYGSVERSSWRMGKRMTKILQVSKGVKVVYDLKRTYGKRVLSISLNNETLRSNSKYFVVLSSFLRTGGDGFSMIKANIENVKTGPLENEYFGIYIKKLKVINATLEGRIVIVS